MLRTPQNRGNSTRAFPGPEELATLTPNELKRHGFSMTKARTIVETARGIGAGDLDLESLERLDDPATGLVTQHEARQHTGGAS